MLRWRRRIFWKSDMSLDAILRSIRDILAYIPWPHWVAIVLVTVAAVALVEAILAWRRRATRRTSPYGAVALAVAVFAGLLFIETTVVIRCCGIVTNGWGVHLNLDFGRLLHLNAQGYESLFNIIAFVPFGFFLAEYLAVSGHRPQAAAAGASSDSATSDSAGYSSRWRIFLLSILITFCLSLCIECLQLALRVGFFELTDLVMNTLGGLLGACLSLLMRAVFSPSK